jgi:spermidine/putrescine transport system substrate-binding protein
MQEVKDLLLQAKETLLAYDDTTFYSKLVSGEAVLVEAWDGWCNYGIAENPDIQYVIPEEGSDLWVDTMVILASSPNIEAAHAFINYILDAENHAWAVENILYKVPNQAAMDLVDPSLAETFPNMGMSPAEGLEGEELMDLGDAQTMYTDIATEVAASG